MVLCMCDVSLEFLHYHDNRYNYSFATTRVFTISDCNVSTQKYPYANLIVIALNEAIMLMEIEAIDEEGSGDENNMNLHER